ncbi:DUF2785 domain-containing protein [Ectobacillus sp. JY-23]|uniref:DUF2785 domain-containing protein n=1 Tax=Ectobacillus sp. JY-23 TaxID=2933872 RepID=UPI001FF2A8B3|nr:DUF2785 domain-containing protein [Ectobacillus sp. JY-23]UOY94139.1 DUF2785 domain-containing protein [Ectobacillus sp. JY-23]
MTNEQELKRELQAIQKNHYDVPEDVDAYPYAQWMLDFIGSTDAELRDELIYSTLAKWIKNGVFRDKELRGLLLQTLSEDYLFYGIGEKETDSVFKRAFSVLIPPLILSIHEKKPFLSQEQLYSVAEQVLEYIYLEKDVRGYVEGKGWAHATAHAADALHALARSLPEQWFALELLKAAHHMIAKQDYVYTDLEDERLASAIFAVYEQQVLSAEEWRNWLYTLVDFKAYRPQNGVVLQNMKTFVRTLYFRAEKEKMHVFKQEILGVLWEIEGK